MMTILMIIDKMLIKETRAKNIDVDTQRSTSYAFVICSNWYDVQVPANLRPSPPTCVVFLDQLNAQLLLSEYLNSGASFFLALSCKIQ